VVVVVVVVRWWERELKSNRDEFELRVAREWERVVRKWGEGEREREVERDAVLRLSQLFGECAFT
jgi:hypothetical protein